MRSLRGRTWPFPQLARLRTATIIFLWRWNLFLHRQAENPAAEYQGIRGLSCRDTIVVGFVTASPGGLRFQRFRVSRLYTNCLLFQIKMAFRFCRSLSGQPRRIRTGSQDHVVTHSLLCERQKQEMFLHSSCWPLPAHFILATVPRLHVFLLVSQRNCHQNCSVFLPIGIKYIHTHI